MKKVVCLLLCISCLGFHFCWPASAQEKQIHVVLNGQALSFDQPPINVEDRVLVPLRGVLEAMGVAVFWESGAAYAVTKQDCVFLTNSEMLVSGTDYELFKNHQPIAMDVQPALMNDRLLVPVRVMSETFGAVVGWDAATDTVLIEGSIPPELQLSEAEILAAEEYTLDKAIQLTEQKGYAPAGSEPRVDYSEGQKCYSYYIWPKEAAAALDYTQVVYADVFADGRIVIYQN